MLKIQLLKLLRNPAVKALRVVVAALASDTLLRYIKATVVVLKRELPEKEEK